MATKTERKTCVVCNRSKLSTNFFKIKSSLFFPDGRTTVCSNCIKEQVDFENPTIADELLRQMNMPFIQDVWDVAITNSGPEIIEINSAPGPKLMQLMDQKPKGQFFREYIKKHGARKQEKKAKDSKNLSDLTTDEWAERMKSLASGKIKKG